MLLTLTRCTYDTHEVLTKYSFKAGSYISAGVYCYTPFLTVPIDTAVTSEINTNNCTCVLLKVHIGVHPQIQLLNFLSPKNMHILWQDLLHLHIHLQSWLVGRFTFGLDISALVP